MKSYDIIIIGGGPGGYVAAIKAAQLGKNVALIEKEAIGGVCLNWGCIPTKAYLKSAKVYQTMAHAKDYGFKLDMNDVSIDYEKIVKRKNRIVKKLTGGVSYLLKKNNVTVYQDMAEAIDAHTVKVGEDTLKTEKLIIATGASPILPPIDGLKDAYEKGFLLTSKEILDMKEIPKTLAIIGGGVIGMEFATVYNAFGTDVTIYEREDTILLGIDDELKEIYKKKVIKDGVKILTEANVTAINKDGLSYEKDGESNTVKADKILLSVGMKANTKGIEKLALKMSKTGIETDANLRTSLDDVYAIGDVNGKMMLAHVASHEGMTAVHDIIGESRPIDYNLMPSGIYTFPEIAQVGLTEKAAKEKYDDVITSTFPLSASGKALAEGETVGLVKLIARKQYREIIGVHILAQGATELISEAVLGMNLEVTADDIAHAVHPHPTLSEMMLETALGIIDKPIHL